MKRTSDAITQIPVVLTVIPDALPTEPWLIRDPLRKERIDFMTDLTASFYASEDMFRFENCVIANGRKSRQCSILLSIRVPSSIMREYITLTCAHEKPDPKTGSYPPCPDAALVCASYSKSVHFWSKVVGFRYSWGGLQLNRHLGKYTYLSTTEDQLFDAHPALDVIAAFILEFAHSAPMWGFLKPVPDPPCDLTLNYPHVWLAHGSRWCAPPIGALTITLYQKSHDFYPNLRTLNRTLHVPKFAPHSIRVHRPPPVAGPSVYRSSVMPLLTLQSVFPSVHKIHFPICMSLSIAVPIVRNIASNYRNIVMHVAFDDEASPDEYARQVANILDTTANSLMLRRFSFTSFRLRAFTPVTAERAVARLDRGRHAQLVIDEYIGDRNALYAFASCDPHSYMRPLERMYPNMFGTDRVAKQRQDLPQSAYKCFFNQSLFDRNLMRLIGQYVQGDVVKQSLWRKHFDAPFGLAGRNVRESAERVAEARLATVFRMQTAAAENLMYQGDSDQDDDVDEGAYYPHD